MVHAAPSIPGDVSSRIPVKEEGERNMEERDHPNFVVLADKWKSNPRADEPRIRSYLPPLRFNSHYAFWLERGRDFRETGGLFARRGELLDR